VIASGETVVGEGFHRKAGEPHAEINALRQAGPQARGATAYVTLEPCNHQGKTGPCASALIEAGVAEVVYGMADPHAVASGGIATLQGAGIHVRGPLMEAEARTLNPGFIKRCQSGLPRVTVKLAMSLDGRTAMASGESQWITSPAARRDVQRLRAESDAIITGIGTVLRDDPALTVRPAELGLPGADEIARRQPLRVVVDSKLRLSATAKLLKERGSVLVATCENALKGPVSTFPDRVAIVACGRGGQVDLKQLLVELADRHCNDILVEAGAELCGAFMAAGLVDRLIVYMAPKLMGSEARPLLALPFAAMAEALELTITDSRAIGTDWRLTAQVNNKETEQA
jgi:diaminohydroxyphosphoribosylaminopyrimidine deaminase/5-amino-6-(5-phosphoribosylamino)uracil reductase